MNPCLHNVTKSPQDLAILQTSKLYDIQRSLQFSQITTEFTEPSLYQHALNISTVTVYKVTTHV